MLKKIFVFLYFVVLVGANADLTVTHEKSLQIECDLTMPFYNNEIVKPLDFMREVNSTVKFSDGMIYPSRSFSVALPKNGTPKIRIESATTAKVIFSESPLYDDTTNEREPAKFASQWVSEPEYRMFGDLRVAVFFIKPLISDKDGKSATVIKNLKFTVEVPAGRISIHSNSRNGDFVKLIKDIVINPSSVNVEKNRGGVLRYSSELTTSGSEKMIYFKVGDGVTSTRETETDENRIVRIKASDFTSLFGDKVPINSYSLFASQREELSEVVPFKDSLKCGDVEIPLMRFDLNNDGYFNGNDYFLAYVSSIDDWFWDTSYYGGDRFDYTFNRLESERTYWLKSNRNGLSIVQKLNNFVSTDTLNYYYNLVRYKKSIELKRTGLNSTPDGGLDWIWKRIHRSDDNFEFETPLIDTLSTGSYATDVYTAMPGYLRINYSSKWKNHLTSIYSNDSLLVDTTEWKSFINWRNYSSGKTPLTVRVRANLTSSSTFYEISSVDLKYPSMIDMSLKKKFRIFSDDTLGVKTYKLINIPKEKTYIFRIGANESDITLVDTISSGGTYTWTDSTGIGITYFVTIESEITELTDFSLYNSTPKTSSNIVDLLDKTNESDYIIITGSDYIQQAERFAKHKASIGKFLNPAVINVDDIYRLFSGGNRDVTAIRNFIFYTYSGGWTSSPDYVFIFGTGNYDVKKYTTTEDVVVPPFISSENCVEDFFGIMGSGEIPDSKSAFPTLFVGRATVYDQSSAESYVDKVIEYEGENADYSLWRNKVLLVADDDMQGNGHDNIAHFYSSELSMNSIAEERPGIDFEKVYLFEYPWNSIFQKPDAANALIGTINNGVSVFNYFGHGSYKAIADERILTIPTIGNFMNKGKYPIFTAFSCSVGRYDKPGEFSLAGLLALQKNAGAILSIASTRTAYASDNEILAEMFFKNLFKKSSSYTVGQAYTYTKAIASKYNIKNYAILGDPSIRINSITDTIISKIFSIGDSKEIDTIAALQRVHVTGVIQRLGATDANFGTENNEGYVTVGFYNPTQDSATRKDGGEYTFVSTKKIVYSLPGTTIRPDTTVAVTNGVFSVDIDLPRRVPINDTGVTLRFYAWCEDGNNFATGIRNDILFWGSDTSGITDSEGPSISIKPLYVNSSKATSQEWNASVAVTDTITSSLPMSLQIDLWDDGGIEPTATAPGEGLTFEIENVYPQKNIASEFVSTAGTQGTQGTAVHSIDSTELKPGKYSVVVTAMDANGNISKRKIVLNVVSNENFDLNHVMNYPNPVNMGNETAFYFYHSNTAEHYYGDVDATIKIYTMSGKLIRIFKHARNGEKWDLKDQHGNVLAPNIYLYRIEATKPGSDYSGKRVKVVSPIKKLIIYPPR